MIWGGKGFTALVAVLIVFSTITPYAAVGRRTDGRVRESADGNAGGKSADRHADRGAVDD